jgi:hypothetical protein
MQIKKIIFLILGLTDAISASVNSVQLDPISVSESETPDVTASFTLNPSAPANSSLTLNDLLLSEGLGVKTMKW